MSSIFRPLNIQGPAQALGQAASAMTAYEQLRGIREARQLQEQQRQRAAMIQQLTGRAMQGDQAALNDLTRAAPEVVQGLQKQALEREEAQLAMQRQRAELPQVQAQSTEATRAMNQRRVTAIRNALSVAAKDPGRYQAVVRQIEGAGVLPAGTLPAETPSSEEFAELDRDLETQQQLFADPKTAAEYTGELERIAVEFDPQQRPDEFREAVARLNAAESAHREAQIARARVEKQVQGVNVPNGLSLIRPEQQPTRDEVKESRRIVGAVAPAIDTARRLLDIVGTVGFQLLPTLVAKRANGFAAQLQLQLKDAFELGALDAGSERFLERMVDGDPTRFRTNVVKAQIRDIAEQLERRMKVQVGLRNFDVDMNAVLRPGTEGGYGNIYSEDGKPTLTAEQRRKYFAQLKAQGLSDAKANKRLNNIEAAQIQRPASDVLTPEQQARQRASAAQQTTGAGPQANAAASRDADRAFLLRMRKDGVSQAEAKRRLRVDRQRRAQQMNQRQQVEGVRDIIEGGQ